MTAAEARTQLYEILRTDAPFDDIARDALMLGKQYLGVDSGYLSRIDQETDRWEVLISTDSADGRIPPGHELSLEKTYCRRTLTTDSQLVLDDAPAQGWADDPAFEAHGIHCYHGTTLVVDEAPYGTVCFVAETPRSEPFTDAETMFAELLTRLLERELECRQHEARFKRQTNLSTVLNRVLRHNIRNDMTIIRGRTQMMADELTDSTLGDTALETIDNLIALSQKARQLDQIIADDTNSEPTALCPLVESVVASVSKQYPSATITVAADDDPTAAVRPSFRRAVQELIENAAKHGGAAPTIEVCIETTANEAEIRIADDGPGLADLEVDVLERGTETPLLHGTGLGLWLTYWIVTNHDGSINPSVTAEGTVMSISIPQAGTPTEQPQQSELSRAHDQYKAAFEEATEPMVIINDDAKIVDANLAAANITGLDRQEMLGRAVSELLSSGVDFQTALADLRDGDMLSDGPMIMSADGGQRQIAFSGEPNIVPGQHLMVGRDITARNQRTEALELSETVFQNTQDAMFLIDVTDEQSFRVQRVNSIYEEMTGLDNAEIAGETPTAVVGEAIGGNIEAQYRECIDRGESITYTEEIPVEGELRQWQTKLTPIFEGDAVVQLVGAMRDITEQHRQNRTLAETNQQLETVMQTVEAAIFIKDCAGRYQVMNQRCRTLLGIGPEEDIVGRTDSEFFPEETAETTRAVDERVIETGETVEIEEDIPTAGGERTFLTVKSPIRAETGAISGICAVATDVTEKQERERLERRNDRLEEFASVVSHDLQNPLSVASGYLALAREDNDSEELATVATALNRMGALIEDLLQLSQEGLGPSAFEPVALATAMENCWTIVETAEATLSVEIDRSVRADRSRLGELFENLLRNAVEHGGDDVNLVLGELSKQSGFYVSDDGPGIPEADRPTVLTHGYSTTAEGTGFGLGIVQSIVDDHGWTLTVTDSDTGGARFEIADVSFVS
jgi:PAS domain S-box-containing protein